ncbi:MAG: L-threonylcarbamoyladenylate synthase [Candidatus Moraniibacteriota bacterium]
MMNASFSEAAHLIARGDIGILPTDTLYGFVASARSPHAVERLYRARGRDKRKPCIVLIEQLVDVEYFDVSFSPQVELMLQNFWPGAVSVIFPDISERFSYLHRGTETLAFRVPDSVELRNFLRKSGPIVAPSANPEGLKPAKTIDEARRYFERSADFFVDGGILSGEPSTLVRIEGEKCRLLRQGARKILSSIVSL